jgi:HSP20 family molecular chaperone IbpA
MYSSSLSEHLKTLINLSSQYPTSYTHDELEYDIEYLENDTMVASFSVLGHNPDNIKLDVTEDLVHIKSDKLEKTSSLVSAIDSQFLIHEDYDGTKTEAKFTYGLLILTIPKKEEKKSKTIKIVVSNN